MTNNKPMPIAEAKKLLKSAGYRVKDKIYGRYVVVDPHGVAWFMSLAQVRASAQVAKGQGSNKCSQ